MSMKMEEVWEKADRDTGLTMNSIEKGLILMNQWIPAIASENFAGQ